MLIKVNRYTKKPYAAYGISFKHLTDNTVPIEIMSAQEQRDILNCKGKTIQDVFIDIYNGKVSCMEFIFSMRDGDPLGRSQDELKLYPYAYDNDGDDVDEELCGITIEDLGQPIPTVCPNCHNTPLTYGETTHYCDKCGFIVEDYSRQAKMHITDLKEHFKDDPNTQVVD